MARTIFFCMVLRKFSAITNNKPISSQYNIFYNYEYFFFQSTFWSLFNHRQRSQSNQEQCSMCCSSPCFLVLLCTHYGPLQCFSTYFRKLKEIGALRPIFPDYVISCNYVLKEHVATLFILSKCHEWIFSKLVTSQLRNKFENVLEKFIYSCNLCVTEGITIWILILSALP